MRPVNLLPEEHRPRRASGGRSGSAYAIVGALVALLVLVTVYVLTANQVSSRNASAAEAATDAQRAQAEIAKLGPFGNFEQVKQVRAASVKGLAQARFDWERFVRELAFVLPRGTWLTEVDAVASGDPAVGGATSTAASGPNAKVKGCAPRQPDVAKLLVRLRKLHRVKDVELKESAQQADGGSSAGGSAPAPTTAAPAGGAPAGGEDCTGRYQFDVVVQFDEAPPTAPSGGAEKVPASLGGGR